MRNIDSEGEEVVDAVILTLRDTLKRLIPRWTSECSPQFDGKEERHESDHDRCCCPQNGSNKKCFVRYVI